MSKLEGKIFMKALADDAEWAFGPGREGGPGWKAEALRRGLRVRWLRSEGLFELEGLRPTAERLEAESLASGGPTLAAMGERKGSLRIGEEALLAAIRADAEGGPTDAWSTGYRTRARITNERALWESEGKTLGPGMDPDSWRDLSLWQALFRMPEGLPGEAKRQSHRRRLGRAATAWLAVPPRNPAKHGGRKKGGAAAPDAEGEAEAERDMRLSHNERSALKRGIYAWWEEAKRERAKASGAPFDRASCASEWRKRRETLAEGGEGN